MAKYININNEVASGNLDLICLNTTSYINNYDNFCQALKFTSLNGKEQQTSAPNYTDIKIYKGVNSQLYTKTKESPTLSTAEHFAGARLELQKQSAYRDTSIQCIKNEAIKDNPLYEYKEGVALTMQLKLYAYNPSTSYEETLHSLTVNMSAEDILQGNSKPIPDLQGYYVQDDYYKRLSCIHLDTVGLQRIDTSISDSIMINLIIALAQSASTFKLTTKESSLSNYSSTAPTYSTDLITVKNNTYQQKGRLKLSYLDITLPKQFFINNVNYTYPVSNTNRINYSNAYSVTTERRFRLGAISSTGSYLYNLHDPHASLHPS